MDDFLAQVTDEIIESTTLFNIVRLKKMRDFLKQEHNDILKKIQEQSEYIFNISNFITT